MNEEKQLTGSEMSLTNRNELATAQLQAQAIAFEQAAFLVAQKNRRDLDVVRQKLLKECERTSFAAQAIYKKPVGSTTVTGLNIRFAEAALNLLGNTRTKRIVTMDDLTRRKILIVVSDLEANTHYEAEITIEKTVERRSLKNGQQPLSSRLNSQGDRVYLVEATEDDMLTKESAIASKFIRQNALRLVPGWLQDECYDAIMETQKKKAAQDPDTEKNKIIDSFGDMGIRADQIKLYLGIETLESLTPKDLVDLRAVYQGIRDGETNWREVMEQRDISRGTAAEEKPAASTVAGKVAAAVQKATGKPPEAQKPESVGEVPPKQESSSTGPPSQNNRHRAELEVIDLELRNRKAPQKGQWILLTCLVAGGQGELAVQYWHRAQFDTVKTAVGKKCDFELERHVSSDDTVTYTLERIFRIGDVAFPEVESEG